MEINKLFPHWCRVSLSNHSWWSKDLDLKDYNVFFQILEQLVNDQATASAKGRHIFYRLCEAITSDTIGLQSVDSIICDPVNLRYLQFESSLSPLKLAINAGEFHTAHNWILNGFSDSVSNEVVRRFYTDRAREFLDSRIPWIVKNCENSLSDWFISFFYYCRVRSALYDTAETLVGPAAALIDRFSPHHSQATELMRSLLDWSSAQNHRIAPNCAAWLEDRFQDPDISIQQKTQIAVSFSTVAGRFTTRSSKEWAEWALTNARSELIQHEPLQLLLTTIETETDWLRVRDEIQTEMDRLIQDLLLEVRSPTSVEVLREQRCDLLNPLVFKLHKFGLRDDLLRMFFTWYGTPTNCRRQADIFFILPNHKEGMAYLGTDKKSILLEETSWDKQIVDINRRTNKALGIVLTVQGENLPDEVPNRKGVPDYNEGQDFERALVDFYQFEKVSAASINVEQAMVSFPAYPHPIQGLMRSVIGQALPISASLECPEVDRSINSVGIWCAGNDLYSEMEARALSKFLTNSGIEVSINTGTELSNDDFARFYQDRNLDLVWVAGHGVYDHWDPMSPAILSGNSSPISIDEILSCEVAGSGRRLLVLNICDGGVAATTGGIHRIGLAAMVASRNQAVVSHHWPVEPRIAAAFGLLFARSLLNQQSSFFQSFQGALDEMRRPWCEIVEEISGFVEGDLVERFANVNFDTSNIFHWASPCFFE